MGAKLNAVNALIYQPAEASGSPDNVFKTAVDVQASGAAARCVQLSFHPNHHAGQHYNSVRWATDEGCGPAETVSLAELQRRIEDSLKPAEPEKSEESREAQAIGASSKSKARSAK